MAIPEDKFLVFDIGSCSTKIGYASEDYPTLVFDTICGEPVNKSSPTDLWSFDKSAASNPALRLRKPLSFGMVKDWEAWEEFVSHCYLQLDEDPSQQPVFMTEPHRNPKEIREKTVQTMFEAFKVPAFYMASQSVLALYAGHNASGVIVHIGESSAEVIPYFQGEARHLEHAATVFDVTGSDVTEYLAMLLARERDYWLFGKTHLEMLRDVKESLCYVSSNFAQESERAKIASKKMFETAYQLPNRQFIEVGAEKFMAPEIFFKPHVDSPGIHEVIANAIKKCDLLTRFDLYNDIVLVGGSTLIPGFKDRLEQELKILSPGAPVRIQDHPNRHLLAWQGASFVAQIPTFNVHSWISLSDYEEFGPNAVHRKCILK